MMSLTEEVTMAVEGLACARAALEKAKEERDQVQTEIDDLAEEWGLADRLTALKAQIKDLAAQEREMRDMLDKHALSYFALTQDKHPHPAVTVTEGQRASIVHNSDVVNYLIQTEQLALLRPDKTSVLKAVRAGMDIPGTTLEVKLGTRVKSNLSEFFGPQPDEPEAEETDIPF